MWAGNTQLLQGHAKACAWLLAHFFMDEEGEDKKLSARAIRTGQEASIPFLQARLEEGLKGMNHRHPGSLWEDWCSQLGKSPGLTPVCQLSKLENNDGSCGT